MRKEIILDYTPTEKQTLFHRSPADEILYGGAAGGGKSKAIVFDAAIECLRHPGINCYLFRRTYPELRDTLLVEDAQLGLDDVSKFSKSEKTRHFANGSKMNYRYCQYDNDRFKFSGAEIQRLYIDELTTFSYVIYEFLKTRLRARKSLGVKPLVRCTSNPGGVGHGWVMARFITEKEPYQIHPFRIWNSHEQQWEIRTRQYIPALPTDNPYITTDYIIELEQKPKALRDALLLGKWDTFEGQAFVEWTNDKRHYDDRKKTHVINPFDIPDYWNRYIAIDHGYSKPYAAVWFAVDDNGRVYLYKELYGCTGTPNKGVEEDPDVFVRKILDNISPDEQITAAYADPQMWNPSKGQSLAAMLMDAGLRPLLQGNNRRVDGKMQFHRYLAFDETFRPHFYVFNTCKHTIRTIPTLVYSQTKAEDVDTEGEDHIYDCIRYFLMSRPSASIAPKPPQPKPFWPLSG